MTRYLKNIFLMIALCMPFIGLAQIEGEYFIMHSSGLHLAKSPSSGILEKASVSNPQKMTISDAGNGYFTIQAPDGTFFAQSGTNRWNTGFINENKGDISLFKFEQSGQFLKIKSKSTGKYLGVDNVTDGSSVFCDKDGTNSNHLWLIADNASQEVDIPACYVMVNPGAPRQQFDGWGVSLCWWAHMCGQWPEEDIDRIIDWLVLPENLNYSVFRYNIGGGDDPENHNCTKHHMANGKGLRAEMPGFKKYEDSEYDWSADEAQIKILRKIKEKRPDAIFEAFSNSAPWWMTNSGCCSGASDAGKDNLNPNYYEAFADYLIDVMKHFKEVEGIEFASIDPFNEPMTNYWGRNGGQEGCHFEMQSMSNFIKVLYPKLKESGLNTIISACDETAVSQQISDVKHFKKDGSLNCVGQVNTHTYKGTTPECCKISALCAAEGIPLWMSEVGMGGTGIQGNLNMAARLIRDMRYIEPVVWCDWQYIEEANDQWCLISGDFAKASYNRVNNYYVRNHITHYIKPGYTIITSTNDNTLAASNPDRDELVLIIVNTDPNKAKYKIDLGLYNHIGEPSTALKSSDKNYDQDLAYEINDSYLTFDLDGLTIATFVMPVMSNLQSEIEDGTEYCILPRQSATDVLTAKDGKVCLQPIELSDDRIWTVSLSDGKATFTNRLGQTISATDSYTLSCVEGQLGTQQFSLSSVGQQYFKIEANNKAFDLEGEKSVTGTMVGMWNYGDDPAEATHRQWRFLPIKQRSSLNSIDEITNEKVNSDVRIFASEGSIDIKSSEPGNMMVSTIQGQLVFSSFTSELSLKLPSGLYVVNFTGSTARKSQLIIIK